MATILAVGAHIGDMDVTAGPALAEAVLKGHAVVMLALTPGERGHPHLPLDEYREQKLAEGRDFATAIGAQLRVLGYSDGFLEDNAEVCAAVAEVIREVRPQTVVTHWRNSIHSDHAVASAVVRRAWLWASLPLESGLPRHCVTSVLYTENWEDAEGFVADTYLP
ncbi:MAG: PIG-L deacetylase family protein, partial [Dehalococcoidia bacterium]